MITVFLDIDGVLNNGVPYEEDENLFLKRLMII